MIRVMARTRDWNAFLKRAKKSFPNEHCEALWGDATVEGFRITKFAHMKFTGEHKSVDYDEIELHRQMVDAAVAGSNFLGTVHTHPSKSFDTGGSAHDHHVASKDGERLMGVVVLYKDKTGTRFVVNADWWIPQPKIAFELER